MRDYAIITDVTSDLSATLLEKLNIISIPMEFTVNNQSFTHYADARNFSYQDFYSNLRAGKTAKTTQINMATFASYFEQIIESGKDILYIGFSSALSGTYQASMIAANELMEKYPECSIRCVDSFGASLGEGLLVYTAAHKKGEGLTLEELYQWALDQRHHVCHWFTVDDLNHLKRGGRISAASAVLGSALSIKPVLHVNPAGQLIPVDKVRGRKKALKSLVDHMLRTCVAPENQTVFIGHGDCFDDAQIVATLIREHLPVKDIIIDYIGPVIGAHSGPGTVALFYFGSEK